MNWPDPFRIDGRDYRPAGLLHRTAISENVLYRCAGHPDFVLKISRMQGLLTWLLWPLLVYMSWREYRVHQHLAGIEGIPRQGPRHGLRGYSHEFIPGITLESCPRGAQLPAGFFEALTRIVGDLHARGVFYADLDRKANIIVAEDGRPWLIDYQSCMVFRGRDNWWGRLSGRLFQRLAREDIYHLLKHRHCYGDLPDDSDRLQLQRSGFGRWWRNCIRLPLRRLRRWIGLRRTDKADVRAGAPLIKESQQDPAL